MSVSEIYVKRFLVNQEIGVCILVILANKSNLEDKIFSMFLCADTHLLRNSLHILIYVPALS